MGNGTGITAAAAYNITMAAREYYGGDALSALSKAKENAMIGAIDGNNEAAKLYDDLVLIAEAVGGFKIAYKRGGLDGTASQVLDAQLAEAAARLAVGELHASLKAQSDAAASTYEQSRVDAYIASKPHVYHDIPAAVAQKVARESVRVCYKCARDLGDGPAYKNGRGWYCVDGCR